MVLSAKQIKAARALLGWGQRDLARISGISLAAIAQIESEKGNPRDTTLQTLHQTFTKYSVEFSDEPGVRIRREPFSVTIWEGHEAMLNCWKDIEESLGPGGVLLISCVDDGLWKSHYPREMGEMYKARSKLGLTTLGLLTSPEKNESGWPSRNYRIVPAEATAPHAPYYVYRDKVALIKMTDPIRIVLIENPTVAESFRGQFQFHWERGEKY